MALSPAREALAWAERGLPWKRIAEQVGLSPNQVGQLVVAHALAQVAAHGARYGLDLLRDDPAGCRMLDCPGRPAVRGLCVAHVSRLRRGYGLYGDVDPTVFSCSVCGALWCALQKPARSRATCGDRYCAAAMASRTRAPQPLVAARVDRAIELLKTGALHREVAAAVQLSRARVGQIARRNGLRRYRTTSG